MIFPAPQPILTPTLSSGLMTSAGSGESGAADPAAAISGRDPKAASNGGFLEQLLASETSGNAGKALDSGLEDADAPNPLSDPLETLANAPSEASGSRDLADRLLVPGSQKAALTAALQGPVADGDTVPLPSTGIEAEPALPSPAQPGKALPQVSGDLPGAGLPGEAVDTALAADGQARLSDGDGEGPLPAPLPGADDPASNSANAQDADAQSGLSAALAPVSLAAARPARADGLVKRGAPTSAPTSASASAKGVIRANPGAGSPDRGPADIKTLTSGTDLITEEGDAPLATSAALPTPNPATAASVSSAPSASPASLAASPVTQVSAAPPTATNAPSISPGSGSPGAEILEQITQQVADAREASRSLRPELTVRHSEFGTVAMRIDPGAGAGLTASAGAALGDWRATLSARDPGFVPAVHAALADRGVAAASESGLLQSGLSQNGASSRSQDFGSQSGSQSGSNSQAANGQTGSGFGGASGGGSEPRYGSSTGGSQGPAQPYSGEEGDGGSATTAANLGDAGSDGAGDARGGALFA